jgi:DNA polymerase III epsilon subunit-like protein
MQLYIPNTNYKHFIIFDIEYDETTLVQLAFLILTKTTEPNIYVLSKSVNLYVNPDHTLSNFFTRYTHITNDFLSDNGIDLAGARALVEESLFDVDVNQTLIISHGVKNDLAILDKNNIALAKIPHHYCTYNMAKRCLKRTNKLGLIDIAAEDGYFMFNAHNAYADVWGTLHAFCFLKNNYVGK